LQEELEAAQVRIAALDDSISRCSRVVHGHQLPSTATKEQDMPFRSSLSLRD
jgi:hypothetical protein